jgi:hypothetical protein
MAGDTTKPGASRRRALLHFESVSDLRVPASFEAAFAPIPAGVTSIYGPAAPFGSAAFAARDAADLTAAATARVVEPIAGWRARGSLWPGQRFLLRVPKRWNARLVVAGCPGQRTEFACDRIFGDLLLASGYAYVCGNKGNAEGVALLEPGATLTVERVDLPRFPIGNERSIVFWQHAPDRRIEDWLSEMVELVAVSRDALRGQCGREPEATYAIGLSNGGYQVRRAIETTDLFDGALTWNPVLWTREHNVCSSLSRWLRAVAEGRLHLSPLEQKHATAYWAVTLWLHATHLDPETSIAYGDVRDATPAQSWVRRIHHWTPDRSNDIGLRIDAFANTGTIRCKIIELASELDYLTPASVHCDPYRALVEAGGKRSWYRSRTVARATHVDSWADDPQYPFLRSGHYQMLAAWNELVEWVEGKTAKSSK